MEDLEQSILKTLMGSLPNKEATSMKSVYVLDRDICCSYTDLTIVPCSGKMKQIENPRNQNRIDFYGLPSPFDLKDKFAFGEISPIFPPTRNGGKIKYFAFAASVRDLSNTEKIEKIGEQIGTITRNNAQIRVVETPFLGCGDGKLHPREAMTALARGFLVFSHPDAVLQLCSDNALSVSVAKDAIDALFDAMPFKDKDNMGEDQLFAISEKHTAKKPSYINNFYGPVHGPQIQQGSNYSAQYCEISKTSSPDELIKLMDGIKNIAPELKLGDELRKVLYSDIDIVDAQVKSPKPKFSIIHEGLKSIRSVLEGAGGEIVAPLLVQLSKILIGGN
jgi:hypothetical protein